MNKKPILFSFLPSLLFSILGATQLSATPFDDSGRDRRQCDEECRERAARAPGAVFAMTNRAANNEIVAFARQADGTLFQTPPPCQHD